MDIFNAKTMNSLGLRDSTKKAFKLTYFLFIFLL